MEGNFLGHLVVLLCFSHLVSLNAAPITRTTSLMIESQGDDRLSEKTHLANTDESLKTERVIRRMDVELNDYPGSGANNRHTPTPRPSSSGCIEC